MFPFGVWPFRADDFCFQKGVSEMSVRMFIPVAAALVSLAFGTSTAEARHHRHRCCYQPVCCQPVCCEPVCCQPTCPQPTCCQPACCQPACHDNCCSTGCCQTACIHTHHCCNAQSVCCASAPVHCCSQPVCCGTVVYSSAPVIVSRPVTTYVTFAR